MGEARKRSESVGATKPKAVFNDSPPIFPHHPSVTRDIWESVLDLLRDGHGLKRICREHPEWPNRITFLRAISESSAEIRNTYARACEEGADSMVDDATEIADGIDSSGDVQRDRLRVEQRRWHASKLRPKKYGEKLEITDATPMTPAQARAERERIAEERRRLLEGGK